MEKSKKIAVYGNAILGTLLLAATICFMQIDTNKYITKSIASGLFVLIGLFNLFLLFKYYKTKNSWKAIILLVGLIFAMLGDIFLIDHFVIGALLFAVGHVFYFIYFCTLYKFRLLDVVFIALIITFALLLILLYKGFEFNGMKMLVVVYAIIITCMLGKALGNYVAFKNTPNLITFLGALLFFFSDMMLLFYVFGGNQIIFDYFCIYTYYPAEFLLAISILLQRKTYPNIK